MTAAPIATTTDIVQAAMSVSGMDYEEEVMPQPAQILLIQAASAAAAPPAPTTSANALTSSALVAPVAGNGSSGTIIYSQRLPPGRLPHVQPPVLCPETRSRVIIEAIDALRARKARPDETRITHWVNRRYGIQKDDAVSIIHQSVDEGSVIRVKYKDSISYRNPAKFARSASHANLLMKQRLQQQVNGGVAAQQATSSAHGGNGAVRAPAAPATSSGQPQMAPIPAIKKILRAIRTLTNKSTDPSAGASIQQVIDLIGQRELGFPPSFVSRVLRAGVVQGTVRLLPSGNYILASGCTVKKKVADKPKVLSKNPTPGAAAGTSASTSSVVPVTSNGCKPLGQKVLLIAPKSKQQTLLQSRSAHQQSIPVPTVVGMNGVSNSGQSSNSINRQLLHMKQQQKQQQPTTAPVIMKTDISVRRRKKMHMRKLVFGNLQSAARLNQQHAAAAAASSRSEVGRGRPISQRKKFKKNLGPDFLEPSDLGMPYLQNTFEPKCDYCDRPASRSPRNKHEEFLVCANKDCGFKAHPKSCLKYSDELISRCRESAWKCQYCKDCCMCDKSGDVESILLCDACDQGYHMACHNPPLASKPDGAWICTSCQIRRKTKVKTKAGAATNENNASDDGFEDESDDSPESEDEDDSQSSAGQKEVAANKQNDNTAKIVSQLQPAFESLLALHPEMPAEPADWSCDDVETFVRFIGFPEQAATFREQEIDGISLLLLKRSDLLTGMGMKLGPAVKIYGHIQRLQMMQYPEPIVLNASHETAA